MVALRSTNRETDGILCWQLVRAGDVSMIFKGSALCSKSVWEENNRGTAWKEREKANVNSDDPRAGLQPVYSSLLRNKQGCEHLGMVTPQAELKDSVRASSSGHSFRPRLSFNPRLALTDS